MNIAIDLDDVTVAIIDGLLAYHNKVYKTNFTLQDHYKWDLEKIWGCSPVEAMNRVYDFYKSDYMDLILPINGAVPGINKLSKTNSLYFITSRPLFLKEKTNKWINKYFPDLQVPVYFTNQYSPDKEKKQKKSAICKKLGIEIIIEDAPSNVADCVENNIKVLLFNRPWNTKIEDTNLITRVYNWQEIVAKLI